LRGETEIKTPVGRIDVLTETHVIEVKDVCNWKHALGQVLSYGVFYPDRKKQIYLFGEADETEDMIADICSKFEVEVVIHE